MVSLFKRFYPEITSGPHQGEKNELTQLVNV